MRFAYLFLFFVSAVQTFAAESITGTAETGSHITRWNDLYKTRKCLFGGGFLPSAGCLPAARVGYETFNVATCELSLVGDGAYLNVKNAQGERLSSYSMSGFASHDPKKNYVAEISENYGEIDTGISLSLGGWVGGDLMFTYSKVVTRIGAEFSSDGKLKRIVVFRGTAPSIFPNATSLGKSLDKISCAF